MHSRRAKSASYGKFLRAVARLVAVDVPSGGAVRAKIVEKGGFRGGQDGAGQD